MSPFNFKLSSRPIPWSSYKILVRSPTNLEVKLWTWGQTSVPDSPELPFHMDQALPHFVKPIESLGKQAGYLWLNVSFLQEAGGGSSSFGTYINPEVLSSTLALLTLSWWFPGYNQVRNTLQWKNKKEKNTCHLNLNIIVTSMVLKLILCTWEFAFMVAELKFKLTHDSAKKKKY